MLQKGANTLVLKSAASEYREVHEALFKFTNVRNEGFVIMVIATYYGGALLVY